MGPQRGASGAPQLTSPPGASPPGASAPYTDNRADAFYAIQCADSLVPTSDAVYHNLAITEDQQVPGFGHTSMFVEPSVCRDDAELAYLVSLQLPAKGTTCNVDQLPFGLSPGP